jgi:hypothetical protein
MNSLDRYLSTGPLTDPLDLAPRLANLPPALPELCRVVQGLMIHVFWAERYGTTVDAARAEALQHRSAAWKLGRILELDARDLTTPRPVDRRLVANCRDFTLLLVTFLRYQGVPARARCGFATYFGPDHYEDHWVCERWDEARGEWLLADAQLDQLQVAALGIDFDPLDVPRDRFVVGGSAWRLCRAGEADPDSFGVHDMHGLWFVRDDLLRDVAALQNAEMLPWDRWGLAGATDEAITSADDALLDRLAELTSHNPTDTDELAAIYESDPRLQVPIELLR